MTLSVAQQCKKCTFYDDARTISEEIMMQKIREITVEFYWLNGTVLNRTRFIKSAGLCTDKIFYYICL